MKKIFAILLCVILMLSVVVTVTACDENDVVIDKLVVYNSADYIYDTELVDFKAYYKDITGKDIEVIYVTFDTNETMLARITQGDSNVDVVCPSEYAIQKLMEGGHLVKLDYFDEQGSYVQSMSKYKDYVHNSNNVDKNIISKIDDAFSEVVIPNEATPQKMTDYFVPYMYGTLGILYNKYAFAEMGIYDSETMNKANWGILFNDDGDGNKLHDGLTGKILMKDSIRDSYGITLFYMQQRGMLDDIVTTDGRSYKDLPAGELINVGDDETLARCQQVMVNQKNELFGYEVDFGKDDLLKGNALVDLAWSGDAMYAVEESWSDYLCPECMTKTGVEQGSGKDATIVCSTCGEECGDYELSYYVPHMSGNMWFDGWVIPDTHDPTHLDAIKLFINFLNTPYAAANNLVEIGYSAAVSPKVVREDPDARAVLCEAYVVNDDSWEKLDKDGNALEKFDYDSWEEFEEYFFDHCDEIDNSNWRYPFERGDDESPYNRSLDTLGVMRDFGGNNKKVVTMWNAARSTGVSALPLLGWTVLAVVVVAGIILLCVFIKRRKNSVVKIRDNN